jgi:hypothetical protein
MPSVAESHNTRTGSNPQGPSTNGRDHSRDFLARGYDTELDARDAVAAYLTTNSLATYDGMPLTAIDLRDDYGDGDWVMSAKWEVQTANFGGPTDGGEGEDPYEFSFDIGTASMKMTKSLGTVGYPFTEGDDVPNFENAIGVNEKGEPQGTDVITPTWTEEYTYRIPGAVMTLALRNALFRVVGKINDATFKYYEEGECRCDGARGARESDGHYRLTVRFSGQENEMLAFGGEAVIPKKGWQYVWIWSQKDTVAVTSGGASAKYYKQTPRYMFVEDVYRSKDFSFLAALSAYEAP